MKVCRLSKPPQRKSLLFINDDAALNQRYRSGLMRLAAAEGFAVHSDGLFTAGRVNWRLLVRLISRPPLVVVSNLRANLVLLAFWWVRGLVIVNGLGRHRGRRFFRGVLVVLVRANRRKALAVQSYADYRYLRRFADHERCHWVPGSGGTLKPIGGNAVIVLVQRDDKIALVSRSARAGLAAMAAHANNCLRLDIVGCRNAVAHLFSGCDVRSLGFLPADQILASGSLFLQPSGYGEGFPHSLADAIVSDMTLLIARREFLRYGLGRLGAAFTSIGHGWGVVDPSESLKSAVAEGTVSARYLQLIDQKG